MKQFILAGNVAYGGASVDKVAPGALAFFYLKDGVDTIVSTGKEDFGRCNLVLGRSLEKGGPVVLPVFRYHMSWERGDYKAATSFNANFTVGDVYPFSSYTVIIVKNGIQFNERNKWTATVATGLRADATKIAQALVKHINNNKIGHGLTASVAGTKITLTSDKPGADYTIIMADALSCTDVVMNHAEAAYGDAAYVQDLAEKCAADAGFEYTYRDAYNFLYPNYPLNPLAQLDKEDTGFTIFTLRFAEPREMKTRDEVVHQVIHVAFPTDAEGIDKFESVLKGMTEEGGLSRSLC